MKHLSWQFLQRVSKIRFKIENKKPLVKGWPFPAAGNTIIGYQGPVTTTSARLTVTNVKGQLIKTITIKSMGA